MLIVSGFRDLPATSSDFRSALKKERIFTRKTFWEVKKCSLSTSESLLHSECKTHYANERKYTGHDASAFVFFSFSFSFPFIRSTRICPPQYCAYDQTGYARYNPMNWFSLQYRTIILYLLSSDASKQTVGV